MDCGHLRRVSTARCSTASLCQSCAVALGTDMTGQQAEGLAGGHLRGEASRASIADSAQVLQADVVLGA